MLDQETKKRINDLRDTLVGKVPDPKSQVEQIMIALIFKFMNDMDKESADLGGKASFFVGDFEKFSWSNMFDPRVSGDELVELYSDAIESMDDNPNIPQIFRDIFKNAFIPYKDPETLRLFLKQINEFEYSKDSEQLGDAFEHILNSLSSQGDAGQFRTPRHIIDFIVEIVDPKKDETVLDPASGTSGFLISAFKHIVNSNSEKSSGDLLSAAERKKIMKNINGYDISPDMVRIGLANMYLHGFPEPNVVEYDALTSEDRWNEYYDVILANPPFMTPKGGIRPHNKFGLKSNRAEVLFVDYILTHLKPKGRAGIIVPEGIIFQSGKAYKELRKKLVENGLFAVVSLPSGVFKPYSGVKTSILFIDKSNKHNEILFSKVTNDGFSLGDQRTPIELNDLNEVLINLKEFKEDTLTTIIQKNKILENVDTSFNLNSYIETTITSSYPVLNLGEVCDIQNGYAFKSEKLVDDYTTGHIPVIKIGNLISKGGIDLSKIKYHHYSDSLEKFIINEGSILIAMTGATVGKVSVVDSGKYLLNQRVGSVEVGNKVLKKYIKILLQSDDFYKYCQSNAGGGAQGNISPAQIGNFQIPLPPLEKQQEIVDEIEQYQKVIDGARQVVESYKTSLQFEESATKFKKYSLLEISEFIRGVTYSSKDVQNNLDGKIVLRANNINLKLNKLVFEDLVSVDSKLKFRDNQKLVKNDILICTASGSKDHIGKVAFSDENTEYYFGGFMGVIRAKNIVLPKYLFGILASEQFNTYLKKSISGASINNINKKILENYFVDIPDIETQKQVVEILNIEQKAVEANIKLIDSFKNKISLKISSLYSN
jgi:type I restriction enzyme M protein